MSHLQQSTIPISPWVLAFRIISCAKFLHTFSTISRPSGFLEALAPNFGGKANFLTLWALTFATLTSALNLFSVWITDEGLGELKKASMVISLPLETAIALFYWPVILIKPELMLPPHLGENALPLGLDLSMHLYPAISLWIDFLLVPISLEHPFGLSPIIIFGIFALCYTSWIEFTAAYGAKLAATNLKIYPYPFLNVRFPIRISIYIIACLFSLSLLKIAQSIHSIILNQ